MFGVLSCMDAANCGRLDDWVDGYLSSGPWANVGLRQGLRLQRRYWIGPLLLPLKRLERCCGPEPGMEFSVPADAWQRKVSNIASGLLDPMAIPPLFIEWRAGALRIRDGSHRHAAMTAAGWNACWVIVWCNSADDYGRARRTLDADSSAVTEQRFEQLRRHGWALFPAAVSNDLVAAATRAIRADLAHNYEPDRQREYDNISFCPDLRDKAPIAELLTHSAAKTILDRALGWNEVEYDHGQIAIRQAHDTDKPYPPTPHIDGTSAGANTIAPGSEISNFTALIGVFLTRVDTEFAGNLTVWPGSHTRLETYFRNQGQGAMQEGMSQIELGDPIQLFADPGDVALCHYQLAHAAAVNLSSNDGIAVYFRVWLKGIAERRWELLTNIWNGWRN
jgi:ectoine hydroxylase-related dioxygenase (phytanoyl-CoA dioxygenase family)